MHRRESEDQRRGAENRKQCAIVFGRVDNCDPLARCRIVCVVLFGRVLAVEVRAGAVAAQYVSLAVRLREVLVGVDGLEVVPSLVTSCETTFEVPSGLLVVTISAEISFCTTFAFLVMQRLRLMVCTACPVFRLVNMVVLSVHVVMLPSGLTVSVELPDAAMSAVAVVGRRA